MRTRAAEAKRITASPAARSFGIVNTRSLFTNTGISRFNTPAMSGDSVSIVARASTPGRLLGNGAPPVLSARVESRFTRVRTSPTRSCATHALAASIVISTPPLRTQSARRARPASPKARSRAPACTDGTMSVLKLLMSPPATKFASTRVLA